MEDKTTPDPPLSHRIDMTRDSDVAFWCRILDVSMEDLRKAVQHVGPQTQAVHQYLREKGLAGGAKS